MVVQVVPGWGEALASVPPATGCRAALATSPAIIPGCTAISLEELIMRSNIWLAVLAILTLGWHLTVTEAVAAPPGPFKSGDIEPTVAARLGSATNDWHARRFEVVEHPGNLVRGCCG